MMPNSLFFAVCKARRRVIAETQKQWFARVLNATAMRGTAEDVPDILGTGKARIFHG